MTFDEAWRVVKGKRYDPGGYGKDWNNNPQWPSQGNGTPPANLSDKPPCPRCNDTKEITLTMNEGDGVPTIVVRPCPLCQFPGGPPRRPPYGDWPGKDDFFKKAWDDVRK